MYLYLEYNQISILQYEMFDGLGQLWYLWLNNNNNISHTDKGTFRFLSNLCWLKLQKITNKVFYNIQFFKDQDN